MECMNCGRQLKEDDVICPVCQTMVSTSVITDYSSNQNSNSNQQFGGNEQTQTNVNQQYQNVTNGQTQNNVNSQYQYYQETEKLNKEFGVTSTLVLSVLELICCTRLFGIIALVLLFVKVKPAIEARNLEEARSSKKIVNILLIVGLVWSIFGNLLYIALTILSEM